MSSNPFADAHARAVRDRVAMRIWDATGRKQPFEWAQNEALKSLRRVEKKVRAGKIIIPQKGGR